MFFYGKASDEAKKAQTEETERQIERKKKRQPFIGCL